MQHAASISSADIWQPNVSYVDNVNGLDDIHMGHINLAVWQRPVNHDMLPVINWLAKKSFHIEHHVLCEEIGPILNAELATSAQFEQARTRLIADIQRLATLFVNYSGAYRIRLTVESVHDVPCPKFHQDNVPLRLICTYAGVGTQWLENSNVNTHADCCGGSMVRNESRIQQLKPFEVALMKGKLWAQNKMGIYHRSPKPEAGIPRLIVKMDVAE